MLLCIVFAAETRAGMGMAQGEGRGHPGLRAPVIMKGSQLGEGSWRAVAGVVIQARQHGAPHTMERGVGQGRHKMGGWCRRLGGDCCGDEKRSPPGVQAV